MTTSNGRELTTIDQDLEARPLAKRLLWAVVRGGKRCDGQHRLGVMREYNY